jgi:hypothetical protein
MTRTKKAEKPKIGRKASRPGLPTTSRTRSLAPDDPNDDKPDGEQETTETGDREEPVQAPLIPEAEMPAVEPTQIVNKRMVAQYVGLSLSRDKDGEKLCSLDFSMTLTKEHDDYVPKKVAAAHKWLVKEDNKIIGVNHIPAQTMDIYDDPKAKKPVIHIVGATVERASLSMIEETGKGKSKKVIRFSFRLKVERDEETIDFAAWQDENQFWLDMNETQSSLL